MAKLRLQQILDSRGITKYGFAKALEVRPPTVQQFFKEGYNPKLSTLAEWAVVLSCSIAELVDESKNRPKTNKAIPTKPPKKK